MSKITPKERPPYWRAPAFNSQDPRWVSTVGALREALDTAKRMRQGRDAFVFKCLKEHVLENPDMLRFAEGCYASDFWFFKLGFLDGMRYDLILRQLLKYLEFERPPAPNMAGEDRLQNLLDWLQSIKDYPAPRAENLYECNRTWGAIIPLSCEIQQGPLVHFTTNAKPILETGFRGVADMAWLGLTKWSHLDEKTPNGFNFAYPARSPEAAAEANFKGGSRKVPYGDTALVFEARYIEIDHRGDKEKQAIFLGSEVDLGSALILQKGRGRDGQGNTLWGDPQGNRASLPDSVQQAFPDDEKPGPPRI